MKARGQQRLARPKVPLTTCPLQASGFELVFEAAEGQEEGFAVLPEWADLHPVRCALPLLQTMPWAPHDEVLRCGHLVQTDLFCKPANQQAVELTCTRPCCASHALRCSCQSALLAHLQECRLLTHRMQLQTRTARSARPLA